MLDLLQNTMIRQTLHMQCINFLGKKYVNYIKDHTMLMLKLLDFIMFLNLFWLIFLLRPNILHLISIKPYLYGGIIARLLRIDGVVSSVSGLGNGLSLNLTKKFTIRFFLKPLLKYALSKKRSFIIVQNLSDRKFLIDWLDIKAKKIVMTNGSGVKVEDIKVNKDGNTTPIISLAARLIRDKGIYEFIQVARAFKTKQVNALFWVIGEVDYGNPGSISEEELDEWAKESNVKFLGYRNDVISLYSQSSIVCLPSYYGEGMPKALLEAAACGRPIVTTDLPGCRDTIISGKTGLLVPPKDIKELERALTFLVKNKRLRYKFGQAARIYAQEHFDINTVVEKHLDIYQSLYFCEKVT